MRKQYLFFVCFLFTVFIGIRVIAQTQTPTQTCTTTCASYTTCSYCAETCNRCVTSEVPDPQFSGIQVNNLPMHFNYSSEDKNSANDICSSTSCGTKNCKAPNTSYSNDRLPANAGACTLTPNSQLPAQFDCRYKDGACVEYCSRVETYSCCASYTTVCK